MLEVLDLGQELAELVPEEEAAGRRLDVGYELGRGRGVGDVGRDRIAGRVGEPSGHGVGCECLARPGRREDDGPQLGGVLHAADLVAHAEGVEEPGHLGECRGERELEGDVRLDAEQLDEVLEERARRDDLEILPVLGALVVEHPFDVVLRLRAHLGEAIEDGGGGHGVGAGGAPELGLLGVDGHCSSSSLVGRLAPWWW